MAKIALVFSLLFPITLIVGCGGNVQTASVQPSPSATPSPAPIPSPSPTPTPTPSPSPTPSPTPSVVLIGDSIAANWDMQAAFPQYIVTNKGIGGNTDDQMLARFQLDVIALHPNAVMIWGSGNGMPAPMTDAQVQNDILTMIDAAKGAGIKVILATIVPASLAVDNTRTLPINPEITSVDAWIRTNASLNGAVLADDASVLVDSTGYLNPALTVDGIHLNSAGYQAIQQAMAAALAQAVQSSP